MFSWLRTILEFRGLRSRNSRHGAPRSKSRHAPPRLTELERRELLSLSPLGAEFLVNTTTAGFEGEPDIAAAADGRFAIAWSDGFNVFAQRFDSAANSQGAEQQVVTSSGDDEEHYAPSIAMDSDGDYTVAWERYEYKGEYNYGYDVHARRFDAAGNAVGAAFQVNSGRSDGEVTPAVAMDSDGDFAVVWSKYKYGSNSDQYDIRARAYTAAGIARTLEAVVNTTNGADELRADPAIAMAPSGNFVVAWSGNGAGDADGIFVRLYNSLGQPLGAEIPVNATTTGSQVQPDVAMDDSGDFVVVWSGPGVGDTTGIFARLFDSNGLPVTGEFLVNETATGTQSEPAVAMDGAGNFVVAWSGSGASDTLGVFGRSYNSAGQAQSGEFLVNETTAGKQSEPVVAMDDLGCAIFVWSGNGPGDNAGIFARLFTSPPTVEISASRSTLAENSQPLTLTISRTGRTTEPLTVQATIGGDALLDVDYTLVGTFTIPAGSASTVITISPNTDPFEEGAELLTVTLEPDASYVVGSAGIASITLADSDTTGATIDAVELVTGRKNRVTQVEITFSEDMDAAAAANLQNYSLVFQKGIKVKTVAVSSASSAGRTVTLTLARGVSVKKLPSYQLTARSAPLIDLAANPLDGNADGTPGDDFVSSLASGVILSAI